MTVTDRTQGFTIARTYQATPQEVWEAWTDPDSVAQWWHPHRLSTPRESVELDPRIGGRYVYTMVVDATGERIVSGGVYLEVTPYERLVFTWGDPAADPDDAPVITVALEPVDTGTLMTFELRGVPGGKGDGSFYDGWDDTLAVLAEHLES